MPELVTVSPDETITAEHTNDIRDRTIQRYTDATERSADHASPTAGDLSFLESTGDVDIYFSGAWRHLIAPVGTIIDHAGGPTPPGYLVCNGGAVSRSTYSALFAQIGTTWGAGDGSTTFNVPDLRGQYTMGKKDSGTGSSVGAKFGSFDHTHSGPSHTHSGPSHSHSNPNVNSNGSHAHSTPNTNNTSINEQTGTASVGSTVTRGTGSANTISSDHTHHIQGTHFHSMGNVNSNGDHVHSQGNTGAAGTGNTGAAGTGQTGSNNPPTATVIKLIKH